MNYDKLAIVIILSIFLTWCGRPLYEMKLWLSMDEEAREQYPKDYAEKLTAETSELIFQLSEVRGESLNSYEPTVTVSIGIDLPSNDPELAVLFSDPENLTKLGFHAPRKFSPSDDLREILGIWRFGEYDNSLRSEAIYDWPRTERMGDYGPNISIDEVRDAVVFREGTSKGDWILYLPKNPDCKWLNIMMDEYCSRSLHSWLAASVVGANSRWSRLEFGKKEIIKKMKSLPESTLADAINSVVGFQPSIWNTSPKLTDIELIEADQDWNNVLKEIGENKPPPLLNTNQTHRPTHAYSKHTAMIYLWKNDAFQRIRIDPRDYHSAVVVLSEPFGGERILQTRLNEEIVYIDIDERVAFYSFVEWLQWAIATEKVRKWKLIRKMAPNASRYPIG